MICDSHCLLQCYFHFRDQNRGPKRLGEQSHVLMVREDHVHVGLFNWLLILLHCAFLLSRIASWFSRLQWSSRDQQWKEELIANLVLPVVQSCLFAKNVQGPIAFPEHREDSTILNVFAIRSKASLSQHPCLLLSLIWALFPPTRAHSSACLKSSPACFSIAIPVLKVTIWFHCCLKRLAISVLDNGSCCFK